MSSSSFASGGGSGAGEVVIIEDIALGVNPTLKIIIRSAGLGGTPNNSGANGGDIEVILVDSSANPIGLALGGQGGDIYITGSGGVGYPIGQAGLTGNSGSSPQQLVGGSGGENGNGFGPGGNGGLGKATNSGSATSGSNGQIGYIKIEIIGERIIDEN